MEAQIFSSAAKQARENQSAGGDPYYVPYSRDLALSNLPPPILGTHSAFGGTFRYRGGIQGAPVFRAGRWRLLGLANEWGCKILGFGLACGWGLRVVLGAEEKGPTKEEAPKELVKLDAAEEVKLGRGMAYQAFSYWWQLLG